MASQSYTNKRPASGVKSVGYSQQIPQQQTHNVYAPNMGQALSDDQFLQWGNSAVPQPFDNSAAYGINSTQYPQNVPSSTQLTRRPANQAMTRAPRYDNAAGQVSDQNGPLGPTDSAWSDDISVLEAKAQVAKREAQAKRKQIPPFVQKLNSFLEDGKNTDLIRWSDDGNSFIVLDEDEFAKTLIPELFKHNNYASFVRQLVSRRLCMANSSLLTA